ncbi:hypothetical protein NDU88_000758 [Pleurodeles waltl]|uniref:Alpha-macroglobulin receptor-binding domain-containing protein n=1 Tax=Pleurodeles waltl TaxID=8319 RepID=A0AAV7P1X8_PLEWA|nr:hypothetical protein NDU88_000758 [Pleurodeles waltl]
MLKGALDDELSITAYSTAALLEAGVTKDANMVKQALQYLSNANKSLDSTYNHALRLYVYRLAEEPTLWQNALEKLMESAKREGGTLHWASDKPTTSWNIWSRVSPAAVEISAYVTLGLLSGKEVTKEDTDKASLVVSWLGKQQNSQGGFVSTQDTLVGLQALAKYSSMTYKEKADVTVKVTSEGGSQHEIHVDKSNCFLWQRAPLSNIPGKYTVTATGNGCVYAQTVLKYNIPVPKRIDTFALEVATSPENCTEKAAKQFDIRIEVSYVGNRVSSNMVVIKVEMLTGFIPVKPSVKKLEKSPMVKKTEVTFENVIIFLEELTKESQTYIFSVEQETHVKNLKPANVLVFDYYNPGAV